MISGEKSYTAQGNVRAPSKAQCIEWVKLAWQSVTRETIVKSFVVCGISGNVDGSEMP